MKRPCVDHMKKFENTLKVLVGESNWSFNLCSILPLLPEVAF